MHTKLLIVSVFFSALVTVSPNEADAYDITGGSAWANRVGPGLSFSLGLNGCLRDQCDDEWDTGVSIGSTVGIYYRAIPNLVIFIETHIGHIPVDAEEEFPFLDVDNDNGMVLQVTGGAEFHIPLTGWVAPYFGFGMGYAYAGVWGEIDRPVGGNDDFHFSLHGIDFQLRFGADFYPFSRVPNFSLGPIFLMSFPYWPKACREVDSIDDGDRECDDVDDMDLFFDDDETPFIFYFGISGRYGF
ncbi:MAG: hypothetical protein GY847_25715 [Proteobacteria bacterium]|nr:hypothetical protein [Pseudomonadota bacterium]